MQAEDFLNDGFLKQFKNGKELYKRGVEKMLERGIDSHLG